MRRLIPILSLSMVLAFAYAGCGDDEPSKPRTTGSIAGTLTDIDSGQPVAGAAVVIVDPATMATRSALVPVDAQGRFTIANLLPGTYSVLVYHLSRVVFDRRDHFVEVKAGETARFDMRLVDPELWSGTVRIEGVVRDAATGDPIPGAYVADVMWGLFEGQEVWLSLIGITMPEWTVTDASGRFEMDAMQWTDVYGGPIGLSPVTVSKSGYVPNTLAGATNPPPPPLEWADWPELPPPLPMPAEGDSVLSVEIRLRRLPDGGLPSAETGAIKGRVVFLEEPVGNLSVAAAVAWTSDGDTLQGRRSPAVPLPGAVTTTDAEGRFVIAELVPGVYSIAPGYLPDDGFTPDFNSEGGDGVTVTAGDTTDAGDIHVMRGIRALSPTDRAEIADTTPVLTWTAPTLNSGYVIDHYEVWFSDGYMQDDEASVTSTSWQVPDSLFAPGDHIRWGVRAYAAQFEGQRLRTVAEMERTATFTVR